MKKLLSYLISAMMLISLMIQPIHAQSKILETNQTSPGDGMFMIGVTGEHYAGYKKEILHKLNMLRYTACREHEYDPNYNLTPDTSRTYNLKTDYGENPTDEQLSEYNGDYWPMVWSDVCEHAAEIRASEFTLYGDHIRPNGNTSPCFSFDGVTKNKTAAECLYATSRSYTDPWQLFEKAIDQFAQEKEAYDAYAKGQGSYTSSDFGHYAICINPANVHVGMSALTITQDALGNALAGDGNFTSFVTLEAGYKVQQSSETERNNSGEITQKVEIKQSYARDVKVPDTITITDGKAQQAKIYASFKRRNDSLAKVVCWPILDGLQSTSSHENVAKMSSDGTITPYGNGTTTITITVNGQSYAFPVTVQGYAHTHTWDDGKITTPATCTEKGVKTYTCTICGDTYTEVIPALGHNYGAWTSLNDKEHQRVCKNDSTHIEKADHEFDEGKITTEPTYTKEGIKTYTCKDCGYTKTEKIEKLDPQTCSHKYEVTVNKPATCTEDGLETFTCSKCGDTFTQVLKATGHDYGDWTSLNATQHQRVCKNDSAHIEKADHEFDEGKITTEPTYTKEGIKTYTCKDCGYTKTEKIEKLDPQTCSHKYEVTVNKPATCTEDGLETFTCIKCGDTFTQVLKATGHDYGDWTSLNASQHQRVCKNDSTHIEKADHEFDEGKITTEPTYTKEGIKTYTCKDCGYTKTEKVAVKSHSHNYKGEVTKQPTCTEQGTKKFTCSICGDSYTKDIPALGHNYGAWTSLNATEHQRVCKNDSTHVEKADHEFDEGKITTEPTYTKEGIKTYTCKDCGYTKTEKVAVKSHSHNYKGEVTKQPTCTEKGVKTYTCTICGDRYTEDIPVLGHDYGNWQKFNDLVHERVCKNDHNHVDKQPHRYDEGKIIVASTCTQTGVKIYTCQDCGYTKRESIPTIEHDYDDGQIVVAPTCVAKGVKVYTCKTCGQTKSEELDYDSHNHPTDQITVVNKKEATATSEGYTGDQKCRTCGQIVKKGTTIPKTNHTHTWNQGTITKAASCIEAGAKTYTCTICGETKTETIPALGHDYGEWEKYDDLIHKRVCKRDIHHVEKQSHRYDEGQVVIKPTCTRVGEKIYICQDCGYMKRENLSKLDHHDYDDGKIVVVPTCTTKGVKVYTCKNCGETKSEELDYDPQNHSGSQVIKNKKEATATEDGYSGDLVCNGCGQIVKKGTVISKTGHAHSWNEGEMTKEPSCTQAGEKVYTCSVCLETKAESIPALGHDYDDGKMTITPTCTKKGEKVYTCKRCGDEKTEALPMDQSNHSLEHLSVQNKKEATITEEGYSGDVICGDCRTIVKTGTVIPKLASSNENNPGTADQNKEAANTDDAKKTSDEKTNQTAGSESDQTNTNVGNKQDETITPVNKETTQQSHSSSYDGNGTNEKQTKQTADLHKNEQVVTNAISNNAQKNDNNNGNTEDHFYKGKSAQTLEQAVTAQTKMIVGLKNDHDIKGSSYRKITLKVKKRAKKSLQLSWKKLPGRMTYLVYGNRCGHRYHFLKKTSKTTYKQGKLKKGTYYKYLVIALGSKGQSVAISKVVHVATKGGLYGNVKAIKMKKTLKLKKKQSYKLPYKLVYDAKKKKIHRPIALESSNTKVVSVQKGKVQGKKKGIAYIYVYAQNGAYAKIKVTVK